MRQRTASQQFIHVDDCSEGCASRVHLVVRVLDEGFERVANSMIL